MSPVAESTVATVDSKESNSTAKASPAVQDASAGNMTSVPFVLSSVESNARTYARKFPGTFAKGNGLWIYDVEGSKYFDLLQCAGALPLGHNHPIVRQAILDYVDSQLPQQCLDLATTAKTAFVQELWRWIPAPLSSTGKIQFTSPSGSDAVEAAMKLVRIATGRSTIIAFDGGYHGHTSGSLAAMGNTETKSQLKTGSLADVVFFPYPHPDKSPFGPTVTDSNVTAELCAALLETKLADPESGMTKPAGIIVECIQGEGGVVPAPREWLKRLRRMATEHDIPLIFDEVQSGFARTGTPFAFEYAGVTPDVIVMSKAVGGSMPLACIVYDEKLDKWQPGSHAGTFRGNQLALVTGARVLAHMRETRMWEHAAQMGALFRSHLVQHAAQFGIKQHIHSIRGRGLMLGIQLTLPGSTIEDGALAKRVQGIMFERYKVIIERGGRHGSVLRVLPPLTISSEEIEEAAELLAKGIADAVY